jgi:hypothetical protein
MNKYFVKSILGVSLLLGATTSCTKLDETLEDQITNPTTEKEFLAISGAAYSEMRSYVWSGWNLNLTSTDECVVPTRGGDWGDGGNWKNLHLHTWDKSHGPINDYWGDGFKGVGTCNRIVETFEAQPASAARDKTLAETKVARAFFYFNMMDAFGNIPIVTTFKTADPNPPNKPRAEVYTFIESELTAALPLLTTDKSAATYGKPTKWVALALLAKLHMNAQVYTGTAQWAKAAADVKQIIEGGKFALDANQADIFKPTNGDQIKETIFAIPFDGNLTNGMTIQMRTLHYASNRTFGIPNSPWNGFCTMSDFYNLYAANDLRKYQWAAGLQYEASGAPLKDGTYHINFSPTLNTANYDQVVASGNDIGRSAGVRNVKYAPDPQSGNDGVTDPGSGKSHMNNDFIYLRYADMLLFAAELQARGGAFSSTVAGLSTGQECLDAIRARAGLTSIPCNLTNVYAERSREMSWEGWRRNDMIRFGTWESSFGFNAGGTPTTRRIFPIPAPRIAVNPNLTQNPGY